MHALQTDVLFNTNNRTNNGRRRQKSTAATRLPSQRSPTPRTPPPSSQTIILPSCSCRCHRHRALGLSARPQRLPRVWGGGSSCEPSLTFPAAAVIAVEHAVSRRLSRRGGGRERWGGLPSCYCRCHRHRALGLSARPQRLHRAWGEGLLARAIIDIPFHRRHRCRARTLSTTIKTRGGERGGIAVLLPPPSTDTRACNVGVEYVSFFLLLCIKHFYIFSPSIFIVILVNTPFDSIPLQHVCREPSDGSHPKQSLHVTLIWRRIRRWASNPFDTALSSSELQQPTGDGSGNSRRRGDGGRGGGRGGGCSGDILCGGSGSGDGDSNVVATTATTAMCDKRG
jgi:uncharacterized membrane protein YgcG